MRVSFIAHSRRVFVDASAYYASVDATDSSHRAARVAATQLAIEWRHLFTTNFVLAEAHALCLTRLGRIPALRFLGEIDQGSTVIVRVSAGDERRAREIITRYTDKDFSLTDATSFAVMERLRIAQAFSFDSDFAQFGFQVIGAAPDR